MSVSPSSWNSIKRFLRPWAGTTDAKGNLTVKLIPFNAYWSSFVVAGQAFGNPIWGISKLGQAFLIPGAGPNVCLGPVVFSPNETLIIQVSGATPNTAVSGTIWGDQSTVQDGSDLPSTLPTASGSMPTFQSPQPLLIMTNDGSVHTTTIPLPAGTHSVALYCANPNNTFTGGTAATSITGATTGVLYAFSDTNTTLGNTIFQGGNIIAQFLVSPYDAVLNVQWQIDAGGTGAAIYVNAYPDPTTVGITSGELLNAKIFGGDNLAIADWNQSLAWTTGSGNAGAFNGLLVTSFGSLPAPWQAATALAEFESQLTAGSTSTIVAAPGPGALGARIYLHSLNAWITSLPANAKFILQDSVGPRTLVHVPENAANLGSWNWDFKGVPLESGNSGLILKNSGTATTGFIIGTLTYSIG